MGDNENKENNENNENGENKENKESVKKYTGEACTKPITANALLDKIVFSENRKELQEISIKVPRNIKHLENYSAEIINEDIYTCKGKEGWIVSITYKLVIDYISEYNIKHKVIKTVEFLKLIGFPPAKKEEHPLIDVSKSTPYLFADKVGCVDVELKNIHNEALLKVFAKLKFKVVATVKEEFELLTAKHGC